MPPRKNVMEFTIVGTDSLLVELRGPIDGASAQRCLTMLRAAVSTGVRDVIIDLTNGHPAVTDLAEGIAEVHDQLNAAGGSLLVEGGSRPGRAPQPPEMAEAFNAYRRSVAGAGDLRATG